MDARARVIQDRASIAEIPIVDAVACSSGDFEGLANALGVESIEPEGAAQASVTQEFNIAPPRERSQWREVLEGDLEREVLEGDLERERSPRGRSRSTPYTREPAVRPDKTP